MVERKRHLAKALTYRVFGSMATGAVALVLSKRIEIAAGVALADTVIKIVLYYVHERVWYHISWGVHAGQPHDPKPGDKRAADVAESPSEGQEDRGSGLAGSALGGVRTIVRTGAGGVRVGSTRGD